MQNLPFEWLVGLYIDRERGRQTQYAESFVGGAAGPQGIVTLLAAIAAIVILGRINWVAMVVIVTLLGTDHPPIRDDGRPLGLGRTLLGMASFLIPIVTFMPEPLAL